MNIKEFSLMQKLIYCTSNNTIEQPFVTMAYYLLLNYSRIGEMPVKELIDRCYTSASMVRRFCQSINYNNFSELREAKQNNSEDQSIISMNNQRCGRYRPYTLYKEISQLMFRMGQIFSPEMLHSLSERFCSAEATIIFAIRPYSTFLQEFQCQTIALGKPVYIFEDISPYRHLIEKAGSKNNVVVVSPTGGILSALGSEIKSVPGDKTAIICENYACGETEGLLQLFDHVYRLKIQTNDIEYMELYGKYAIEFLFEMILGDTIAKLQSNRNKP